MLVTVDARGFGWLGSGDTGSCEEQDVGAKNRAWVFCKNSKCFQLLRYHLRVPRVFISLGIFLPQSNLVRHRTPESLVWDISRLLSGCCEIHKRNHGIREAQRD